jgi:hypothetical protein
MPEQGGIGARSIVELAPVGQIPRARPLDAVDQVVDSGVTASIDVVAGRACARSPAGRQSDQARYCAAGG